MNYIKKTTFILAYCLPLTLIGQGWVNHGANILISTDTEVTIKAGELINQNNGTIDNQGTIHLDLDWTQNGSDTNYSGNGWVWLDGPSNQTIASASNLTVDHLGINNAHLLVLRSHLNIGSSLDLNHNGSVELSSHNLVINSGASILNYDTSNYIISNSTGHLQQEVASSNVVFPVGNSCYNPATLSNAGTIDHFQVRVEDQLLESGTSGTAKTQNVVDRSWIITESNAGESDVTLWVQWDASDELSGFNRSQSGIARWAGSYWHRDSTGYAGATGNDIFWTQSRSTLSSFGVFGVEDVDEILTSSARGTTSNHHQASHRNTDTTQADGKRDETRLTTKPFEALRLFPIPVQDQFNIQFGDEFEGPVHLSILAASGQLVYEQEANITVGQTLVIDALGAAPAGPYFVRLTNGKTNITKPIVKIDNN
ncbi:MAG: T9SS type A sorting domain-containing protein [Bacteroidota bacterium]